MSEKEAGERRMNCEVCGIECDEDVICEECQREYEELYGEEV